MQLETANIDNLQRLWRCYVTPDEQAQAGTSINVQWRWPYRVWCLPSHSDEQIYHLLRDDTTWLDSLPPQAVLPVWPRISSAGAQRARQDLQPLKPLFQPQGWLCTFTQTAMVKCLDESVPPVVAHNALAGGLSIERVRDSAGCAVWRRTASEAFAYSIDLNSIVHLLSHANIQLLLGCVDGEAVATALLFKTGDVVGIHQVGVVPSSQGQGIAKQLMLNVLQACRDWSARYCVLQASQAGLALYQRLGFNTQFSIDNYQRVAQ